MHICRKCHGKGYIRTGNTAGDWKTCPECNGDGYLKDQDISNEKSMIYILFFFIFAAVIILTVLFRTI